MQSARGEDESLRKLSSYVARQVFKFDAPVDASARSLSLNVLKEVARRNALTVAGWQAHGFMHGVMNTDNIAMCVALLSSLPLPQPPSFPLSPHIC